MSARAVGAALAALLLLVGAVVWQYRRAEQAEARLGLDASRALSAVFTQAQQLRVATLTGEVLTRSERDGLVFDSEQVTRAPYRASYHVDMGQVGAGDYAWDAERRLMVVRIPDVAVEPPAIDMGRARVRQRGLWISRGAGLELQRQAAERLALAAGAKAKSPENLARARAAAAAAVTRLVAQPLAAAGLDDVKVEVRFPWQSGASNERWDASRSPAEVLREPRGLSR
jgi:hypothetical protein